MANAKRPSSQGEDIVQLVSTLRTLRQSVESGESLDQFKATLRSNRGSLEKIVALLRKEPAAREEAGAVHQQAREVEGFIRDQLRQIATALADIDRWRVLAAKSRSEYRRELDEALSGIKALLNRLCGIEPHRRRGNAERDKIIHEIKSSKPQLSFGQVALEYNKVRTRKSVGGKVAERSYKRHEAHIQAELEHTFLMLYRPDALIPPVPHKPTT